MGNKIKKLIGDKKFYRMVLLVAVPIMIQNGFTNFVSMLDNIMVGMVGTEQMSGVAIVNQLIFVYNLCLFGGLSGVGIFTAQFFGMSDNEGIRSTFRFKLLLSLLLTVLAFLVFFFYGDFLINRFLTGSNDGGDLGATLAYAKEYLGIMLVGLIPFMLVQVYASTLRECGQTLLPMKAGIVAVIVNLVFNFLLIYGKFGFPCLGVKGAALATVFSRFVEAFIVLSWTHRHKSINEFVVKLYSSLKVPRELSKRIVRTGSPLLLNETLWSAGVATLTQCYSVRGLNAIAAFNIANTINNVFNVVFLAFGSSVGIIVGRLLGAGKMEEAVETDNKIIAFSIFTCFFISAVMIPVASLFPSLFQTTSAVKAIATSLILAQAACLPLNAFKNATYFTLRSGGRTLITFFFDGGFIWVVSVPIAFLLSRFTDFSVLLIFICVQMGDLIKCILGFILVKKKIWVKNIVSSGQPQIENKKL